MSITNLFYDKIYEAASAFPYSNDLMHAGLIGALHFLTGRYVSRRLGFSENKSNAIGGLFSLAAEGLWLVIESGSPFDHPEDIQGKLKGVGETILGAGAGFGVAK